MGNPVIGVIGGCGGIGASRFSAVLAATATAAGGRALLADLEPAGGGIDVLVGAEAVAGPRWSQLHLAGGALDPELLVTGLPAWGRVAVLACDRQELPAAEVVTQLIEVAVEVLPVVLDLSRWPTAAREAALAHCTMVALLSGCDLAAITAARAVRAGLGDVAVAVITRGPRVAAARVAELIGAPMVARLPPLRGRDGATLDRNALPRAARRVALGLLRAVVAEPTSGWLPPRSLALVP